MTPQELKNSILQLAIQGKLVEQRPEEGTAEELLSKRKCRNYQTTGDEPDIPESWKWVYLPDAASILYGFPFESHRFNETHVGNPIIRIRDILPGQTNTFSDEICEERYRIKQGDMLVGMDGNFQVAYWKSEDAWLNQRVCRITTDPSILLQSFLFNYLPTVLKEINGSVSYSTVKHLSAKILDSIIIPLPPLAEQKRIVAKIEELLPLIDRYEKAWSQLEEFNKRFPDDMQKSILQMAIQGKLVEQRPEEGTGEELYQQIQAEKQKLIKEGKIKKEKPLPVISEEEKPFDIPESWKWVRFSDIATFINGDRGKNYPNKDEYVTQGVAWINTGHITSEGYLNSLTMNYITEEKYESLNNGKISIGDIVYCLRGATFGKAARIEPFTKGAIASSLMIIRLFSLEIREFAFLFLKSPLAYQQLHLYNNGSAQPNLAAKDVAKYLVPLPPLAEQKRILSQLNTLLDICERLEK